MTNDLHEQQDQQLPEALETLTVGEGDDVKTIPGYTQVDSIRKFYGGGAEYDTTVTLVKNV